jgi:hypothetical protein
MEGAFMKLSIIFLTFTITAFSLNAMEKPKKSITPNAMARLITKGKQEKLKQILGNVPSEGHNLALEHAVINQKISTVKWLLSISDSR